MNKAEKLKNLHKKIKSCRRCNLWKGSKNAVPGEGPARAKIMLIGEAPGREEDLIGKPFVGRAGKLLNQLLAQSRIKREKIFITSVIKHRPPNNRTPKREEIEACKIWWQKQVDIINPSLIILLGRVASDTVIGKEEFKKARGNFLTKNNRRYFVTYHPAAGLRFPKIKKILERDFRKLKKMSL